MKIKLKNIAPEGTCSGDVAGGLYLGPGKAFRRFCFVKGGYTMELKQEVKRKRPPLALISYGGKVFEKPSNINIIDEINLTVIPQVRVCYDLFMTDGEGCFDYPKGKAAVANSLFVAIERLECLLNYIDRGVQHVDQQTESLAS